MIISFFLVVILPIITLLYIVHQKTKITFAKYKDIPGPAYIPIFGNILHFISDNVEAVQNRIAGYFDECGDTFMIWCAWQYMVITASPRVVEQILSSTNKFLEKNFMYDLLKPWLMEGLLISADQKWHSRRKILTPAFHFNILESFIPIFEEQGQRFVEKIRALNLKENQFFNIHEYVATATVNAIAETSMGVKFEDDSTYAEAVQKMTENISNRFIRFYCRNSVLCFFTRNKLLRDYKKYLKILHEFTMKMIVERRHLLEKSINNEKEDNSNAEGPKRRMVFLDILLRSTIDGKPLTNLDIREEVDTFMFEGHDTTTAGLCFTLYLISRHAEVQRKLFNEIVEVIGKDKNRCVGYGELQKLKYLNFVIKESLRLHPPVSIVGRRIDADSIIDGKRFPKGTEVILHLSQLMRNPEIFENPDDFVPERHCDQHYFEANPFAFVPFSGGPRNCIGQRYAMFELKSIISTILRNFELLPNGPAINPVINIILKSTTGFNLGFKKRRYEYD